MKFSEAAGASFAGERDIDPRAPSVNDQSNREDPKVQKIGLRKAFHLGSNSSCRQHIRQHYEIYKARCEAQNIPVQTQAIPRPIWKAMNAEKDAKGKKQTTLDNSLAKMPALQRKEFTKEGAVDAVVRLIVLDDQVSTHPSHVRVCANSTHRLSIPPQAIALAEKAAFKNCLVAMRPKTKNCELPSRHDVEIHIKNQFTSLISDLKQSITVRKSVILVVLINSDVSTSVQAAPGKVSITIDGWTADFSKKSFLGVTAHWIDVSDSKWTLRSAVIAFRTVSGSHTGENLARYLLSLCDRVGITSHYSSKVLSQFFVL